MSIDYCHAHHRFYDQDSCLECPECANQEKEGCTYCEETAGKFAPRHKASERCESGKRNHCSCDICF